MTLFDYLDKYGELSFEELPFNEIDAVMLTQLSYLDLEKICPYYIDGKGRIPIKSLNLTTVKELGRKATDGPNCIALIKKMAKATRYNHLGVGLGHAVRDSKKVIQYASFTFFLPDGTLFIAFRGTDTTLLGWKEDCQLAYQDVMSSHPIALEYVQQVLDWYPDRNFYLAGHSKGGNLASYVTFNLEEKYMSRLIRSYTFDGPGFRKVPEKFEERKGKIMKFLTREDIIGCWFNLIEDPIIIISNTKLAGGHNPFSWQVDLEMKVFKRAAKRSKASYAGEAAFNEVLGDTSKEDVKLAAEALFAVFWKCETVLDLAVRLIPTYLKKDDALAKYTAEQRVKIKTFLERLIAAILQPEKKEKEKKKLALKLPKIGMKKPAKKE